MKRKASKKIIYIDSDSRYRKTALKAFREDGYDCLTCEDGKHGLESARREHPQCIIVDSQLPDLSGEEFFTAIRTKTVFRSIKDVPLILLTHNGEIDRLKMYSLGFSACLSKPFVGHSLVEFVEDVLVSHQVKMEEMTCWERIHEAKDFLEIMVESSADAILTTDVKGVITYCNRAAEELLGYPFEDLVGKRVSKFFLQGATELIRLSTFLSRRSKLPNYKTVIVTSTNEQIHINASISSMRNGEGRVMGALGICKEIDGENFSEYDVNESDRLATVVETAIAVNHAINNPLVPILGNAQFLLQDERLLDEDIRRRLRVIVKNALRIRDITQKLANITRPVTKEYLKGTRMLDIEASS